ncbi:MAG: hypothetical protein H0X41_12980 [Chitinophagaceae bacterium]|nr:hypothetical protein [Chitinophagaceae bacterium]
MPPTHSITLQEAINMTKMYRDNKDTIVKPEYTNLLPLSETFDKAAFEELTSETGCTSIRCYLGMDENLVVRLIFVGVTDKDEDILPPTAGASIMENGEHCPPLCPGGGPLNS